MWCLPCWLARCCVDAVLDCAPGRSPVPLRRCRGGQGIAIEHAELRSPGQHQHGRFLELAAPERCVVDDLPLAPLPRLLWLEPKRVCGQRPAAHSLQVHDARADVGMTIISGAYRCSYKTPRRQRTSGQRNHGEQRNAGAVHRRLSLSPTDGAMCTATSWTDEQPAGALTRARPIRPTKCTHGCDTYTVCSSRHIQ